MRAFFKPAARYPADPRAVFILALSVFSGLTAVALGAAPDTLESLLPEWAVLAWGILLTVGSAITLTGMAFQSLNGILIEQIGSVVVGVATLYYSGLAFYLVGADAAQTVGIVAAWGLACFVRWIQLQALIADGEARAVENAIVRRIEDEYIKRTEG
jgi:hypothetical protein